MNILLAISGGIAAYKSAEIVRGLRKQGADVRVVMTAAAQAFITPLTLQALSGNEVRTELYDQQAELGMSHIELARWADRIVIAPATANCLAKLVQGMADDLLTTVCLASEAPLLIAPAMNQQMWHHQATQDNIAVLQQRGVTILGPGDGEQACGEVGPGRMLESDDIIVAILSSFANQLLLGKHVVITAGPTREKIDPVRYLSNASSGKMGFAIAAAAYDAGAKVTLVHGPVTLLPPTGVDCITVESAEQMLQAADIASDIFIAVAAVADYRVDSIAEQKIKKYSDSMQLNLIRNPDIVAHIAARKNKPYCVGFALETENLLANAQAKLNEKNLDMVVANELAFDSDKNQVTIIENNEQQSWPEMSKSLLAEKLIQLIATRVTVCNKSK